MMGLNQQDSITMKNKMLSFKQFLYEMPELIDPKNYDKEHNKLDNKSFNPNLKVDKFIGHTDTGHHLMKRSNYFYALNPNHNKNNPTKDDVDMMVNVHENPHGFHQIDTLHGRSGSELKAHNFYASIIRHGYKLESSATHSIGGMKTWRALSKYKDIKITHHNDDNSERQLHKHFKDNYVNKPDDDEKEKSFFRAEKK